MNINEIKEKIAIIKNTKDIENIQEILSYADLGAKIKEVLNAVLELSSNNNLDFAAQQFVGFNVGKWSDIIDLVTSMGLTLNEWKHLESGYSLMLDDDDLKKINNHFKN